MRFQTATRFELEGRGSGLVLSARSSLIIHRRPQEVEKGCQKVGHDCDQKGKTKMAEKIFRHEVHVSEPHHYHTEKRKQRGRGRSFVMK